LLKWRHEKGKDMAWETIWTYMLHSPTQCENTGLTVCNHSEARFSQ